VALTAMEIATLCRLFPDRLTVGVGHGVQQWMAQIGARPDSPVTLLREYLAALRALLRGRTVSTTGRYVNLDQVALDWPPPAPPAILTGVTGPRSLRLSGEAADGTILSGGTRPDDVRKAIAQIAEGRTTGGRTEPHPVAVYLHAATGPTGPQRVAAECARWGYESTMDVSVVGDAEQVAAEVRRWADAGADTVVLQPTPDDPDPEGFMHFVGAEVAPLLR
jgi:alkanesulfonate monooxygenase SsuD/methylene tetrahydromethanopterin reductase-like flavin-dependent oxidoreductase (luciferase family)